MKLGLSTFAKLSIKRQIVKQADTFVIIYGLARTGKTTLAFKILFHYLKLKRRLYKEGKSNWKVERSWLKHFKKYFATDSEDMSYKIKHNPDGSYTFVDEGLDVASWHERLTKEQKDLLVLVQKTGKKGQLTLLLTPSFSILTKDILARAHYLFIIPDEPTPKGNNAYLFRQYKVPFLAEKNPFGLNRMIKDLQKYPFLFDNTRKFKKYLKRQKRLVATIHFKKMNQKLYDLYDKVVKEPSIMKEEVKRSMVSYAKYFKLRYMFDTLIYNLYVKDGKSIAQIERLFIDKFGVKVASNYLIQSHLNKMMALEIKPKLSDHLILEKAMIVKPEEDIELSTTLSEEIESHIDASKQTEEGKQQINTG